MSSPVEIAFLLSKQCPVVRVNLNTSERLYCVAFSHFAHVPQRMRSMCIFFGSLETLLPALKSYLTPPRTDRQDGSYNSTRLNSYYGVLRRAHGPCSEEYH